MLEKMNVATRDIEDLQRLVAVGTEKIGRLEGQKGILEVKLKKVEQELERLSGVKIREPEIIHDLNMLASMKR